MDYLPDWLGNLSSIQELYIHDCENMMYLPTTQAMQRLIKLEQLSINDAPNWGTDVHKGEAQSGLRLLIFRNFLLIVACKST